MFTLNTNNAHCVIQAYLDKNTSLSGFQKNMTDIVNFLHDHEKKASNDRNYDEAEKTKYIYELLIIKKNDFDIYVKLENEANIKRNYKEASLIKTISDMIILDIKQILMDRIGPIECITAGTVFNDNKDLVNQTSIDLISDTKKTEQGIKDLVNQTSIDLINDTNKTEQGIKDLVNQTSLESYHTNINLVNSTIIKDDSGIAIFYCIIVLYLILLGTIKLIYTKFPG